MKPIEVVKQAEGTEFRDRNEHVTRLELLPPLTADEIRALESTLPCPLPDEARELFSYCRGFKGAFGDVLEGDDGGVVLSGGEEGQVLDDIFPHAISMVSDVFGNSWIVDLTSESTSWGPIFYSCHDAPVIVFQTDSLAHFITEVLRLGDPPWQGEVYEVHEEYGPRIWSDNPGVMTHEQCLQSGDADLETFARSLDETFLFVDLRNPRVGDGFSWGRYGPYTVNRRFGEKRIFAYQQRKSFWQRLRGS